MMEVPSGPAEASDAMSKAITVIIAIIAATGVFSGYLNTLESSREGDETRSGLQAQSQASETSIQRSAVIDADFDYISSAEIHTFTAYQFEAQGLTGDADREKAIAEYILRSTYGAAGVYADRAYYTEAMIVEAVEQYLTAGFDTLWLAWGEYTTYLQVEADAKQAAADAHLVNASNASRRGDGFMLSAVLMALAVAMGTMALVTRSAALRVTDIAIIATLYALGLANLLLTFLIA